MAMSEYVGRAGGGGDQAEPGAWRDASVVRHDPTAPPLTTVDADLRLAARGHLPVLITAEGRRQREVCARLIHSGGGRVQHPFVTFALEGTPLQHRSSDGAGPSAAAAVGLLRDCFARAQEGTLYIDDLARLTHDIQVELYALLDTTLPVGSDGAVPSQGARIIAGASRHLRADIAAGTFLEALFYRLNVVHIDLIVRQALAMRDLMAAPVRTVDVEASVAAAAALMSEADCGFAPVLDRQGRIAGVLTDRDICVAIAARREPPERIPVSDVMHYPVHTCTPADGIERVLDMLRRHRVRRLPVVDARGDLCGVISISDIVDAAIRHRLPQVRGILATLAAIGGRRERRPPGD